MPSHAWRQGTKSLRLPHLHLWSRHAQSLPPFSYVTCCKEIQPAEHLQKSSFSCFSTSSQKSTIYTLEIGRMVISRTSMAGKSSFARVDRTFQQHHLPSHFSFLRFAGSSNMEWWRRTTVVFPAIDIPADFPPALSRGWNVKENDLVPLHGLPPNPEDWFQNKSGTGPFHSSIKPSLTINSHICQALPHVIDWAAIT